MDLGRAFGFVTEDESWLSKILIGGVLIIIPLIGSFALLGYTFDVARNVAQNNPRPLPDWSDFGNKLIKGLYGFVISLVYTLPLALVFGVLFAIIGVLAAAGGESEAAGGLAALLLVCLYVLMIPFGLVISALILAAYVRYIQTDSLGAALQFGEVWGMVRSAPGKWILLMLISLLCSLVASVGLIACGIGILFTGFYSQAVFGHALGQVAAQSGGTSGYDSFDTGEASPIYQ